MNATQVLTGTHHKYIISQRYALLHILYDVMPLKRVRLRVEMKQE